MAILKNNKHKEYTRFAAHCLEMVTITRDQESSVHSTRNGCRMAAAGGCCSSSIEIRDMIQLEVASAGGLRPRHHTLQQRGHPCNGRHL